MPLANGYRPYVRGTIDEMGKALRKHMFQKTLTEQIEIKNLSPNSKIKVNLENINCTKPPSRTASQFKPVETTERIMGGKRNMRTQFEKKN